MDRDEFARRTEAIRARIQETLAERRKLSALLRDREGLPDAALWDGAEDGYLEKAAQVGVLAEPDEDENNAGGCRLHSKRRVLVCQKRHPIRSAPPEKRDRSRPQERRLRRRKTKYTHP